MGETFIYYKLDENFLMFLSKTVYNPIRLPMVCPPKIWEGIKDENTDSLRITNIGDYLLDEFNNFGKNTSLVRENTYNKINSEVSIY